MAENAFIKVDSQKGFNAFLTQVDHFHDSLVKKILVATNGYVDEEFRMYGDGDPYNVHFIVQSQSPAVCCFEIVFEDVKTITLDFNFPLVPSGSVEAQKVMFSLAQEPYSKRFMVVASIMKYRMLGKSGLGQMPPSIQ